MTFAEVVDILARVLIPGVAAFGGAWIRIAKLESQVNSMNVDFDRRLRRIETMVDSWIPPR
jgi:hypothetical protein